MISVSEYSKIKRILVISLSNIGDVILTTPVISFLRQRFSASFISVLVGPKGAPLLEKSSTINEVILYQKNQSWLGKIGLVFKLRSAKFDLVVDLRNTAFPVLLGSRYKTSIFHNHSSTMMRQKHLDQLKTLFEINHFENNFQFFSETEKNLALQKLKSSANGFPFNQFIVIAPGAGSELKRWTLDGFSGLIQSLIQKTHAAIVFLGDEREAELGSKLAEKVKGPMINLIGKLSLRESAALLSQAELVIANDSAIMHLAHELKKKTIAIFGPTNDKKYGRLGDLYRTVRFNVACAPCESGKCLIDRRKCLDDLGVPEVFAACEDLLKPCLR